MRHEASALGTGKADGCTPAHEIARDMKYSPEFCDSAHSIMRYQIAE